jgi:hypothetical protein
VNIKTIVILVIILLVGVLTVLGVNTAKTYLGSAAAGSEPKNVLAQLGGDGKSATVTWTTEKEVEAVVEYGTTPASLLLRSIEPNSATDHKVVLTPLKSGVNYYFRIRVGEEIFDNSGIPYSFKTKESEVATETSAPVVPTPTVVANSGCSSGTDFNGDGVKNSLDYIECVKKGGNSDGKKCVSGVDYDGNGVKNSLDMIKCLQNK